MTNFEKITKADIEELTDMLVSLIVDLSESDVDDICSECEYYDETYGCMNFGKWTNDICDPHGVPGRKTKIQSWLMSE